MKRRLSVTNLSSENNLLTLQLSHHQPPFCPNDDRALSRNVGKLFSELKLVTDSLLFTSFTYSKVSNLKLVIKNPLSTEYWLWEAVFSWPSNACLHRVVFQNSTQREMWPEDCCFSCINEQLKCMEMEFLVFPRALDSSQGPLYLGSYRKQHL